MPTTRFVLFALLAITILNFWPSTILILAQDVKICPAEPSLPPGEPCPAVCNRGCINGVCEVYNPISKPTILPDFMPSRVICDSAIWYDTDYGCADVDIICSERASCDVVFLSGGGRFSTSVDCRNTTHSCHVACDSESSIYDWRCNATSSCNCQLSSCSTSATRVVKGVSDIGSPCYRNLPSSCFDSVNKKTMILAIINDTCSCECVDKNLTRFRSNNIWGCGDPASACSEKAECGSPLRGTCIWYEAPNICKCFNPWGGPKCDTHMCPMCKNSAFCSNSTTEPCLCTGMWNGTYCDIPLQLTPSLDNDEHVARCGASSSLVVVSPSSSPPPCPPICSECSMDQDGTPVCRILLPIPNADLVLDVTCPTTHRCILHCAESSNGYATCPGPYPCDILPAAKCAVQFTCNSPVGCRFHCKNFAGFNEISPFKDPVICPVTNGSCFCDAQDCPQFIPCLPGVSCNGDPCAGTLCDGVSFPVFNETTRQCGCKCPPDRLQTDSGYCASVIDFTNDCPGGCGSEGLCKDGKCWCYPGFTGPRCEIPDSCTVRASTTASCPSECSFCMKGICFIRPFATSRTFFSCPVGWPCVTICDKECGWFNQPVVTCPAGAGPCEIWCWDSLVPWLAPGVLFPGEFREFSPCTTLTLICKPGSKGCKASCTRNHNATSPYYQQRTIRGITCGSTNLTAASPLVEDRCGSCGTDSCYVATEDPCYESVVFNSESRIYGYLPACPRDAVGRFLVPAVRNETLQPTCDCICPDGLQYVNGSCSADGCDPTCKNGGVCEIASQTEIRTFKCRCFGGWNGKDCTSRCFFPVAANVTLCENGRYKISGQLTIPDNRTLSLYEEVKDLEQLEIDGDLLLSGSNSQLNVSVGQNSTAGTVKVSGDWIQANGSLLVDNIFIDPSKGFVVTFIEIDGVAQWSSGELQIRLSAADALEYMRRNQLRNISIPLLQFGSSTGDFKAIRIETGQSSANCEQLRATTFNSVVNQKSTLTMLFTLDASACKTASENLAERDAINAGAIAAGVLVPLIAIGIGVAVILTHRYRMMKAQKETQRKLNNAMSTELKPTVASTSPPLDEAVPKSEWKTSKRPSSLVE